MSDITHPAEIIRRSNTQLFGAANVDHESYLRPQFEDRARELHENESLLLRHSINIDPQQQYVYLETDWQTALWAFSLAHAQAAELIAAQRYVLKSILPMGQCFTAPDGQCVGHGCVHDPVTPLPKKLCAYCGCAVPLDQFCSVGSRDFHNSMAGCTEALEALPIVDNTTIISTALGDHDGTFYLSDDRIWIVGDSQGRRCRRLAQ